MMDDKTYNGPIIHFKYVGHTVQIKLANKLDPVSHVSGKDWRMLAEKLGFSMGDIVVIKEQTSGEGRNTLKLFHEYSQRQDCSVNSVLNALKEMEHISAVEVLMDAIPEIEARYFKDMNERKHPTPAEHEHYFSTHSSISSPGVICVNLNLPQCLAHGNSSVRHNFDCHNCHPKQPCRMGMSQFCQASIPRPGYDCSSSVSSGCSKIMQDQDQTTYTSQCSYCQTSGGNIVSHGEFPSVTDYSKYSPCNGNVTDSMIVHSDGHQNSFHSLDNDVEMMDVHTDVMDVNRNIEHAAPLPHAIYRAQNNIIENCVNVPSMMSPNDFHIGREVEVSTSEDAVMQNSNRDAYTHKLSRQVSDECNSKQPMSERKKGVTRKIISDPEKVAEVESPLQRLQNIAALPEKYMPNKDYKKYVADQKVDDTQPIKSCAVKTEKSFNDPECSAAGRDKPTLYEATGESKRVTPRVRMNGAAGIPKTFPMRMKSHISGMNVDDIRHQKPHSLMKSVSMPNDMKPVEFRKAFRHIKVFVTYANDTKKHVQRVLSLCNCLMKNGFSCAVDVNGQPTVNSANSQDNLSWLQRKFEEADFVLVCPSPKYLADISNPREEDPDTELHTKTICRMMELEHSRNGHSHSSRFIPVIFDGISQNLIPSFLLKSKLRFEWPRQYKDLLWMMTKPEERMKPITRSYAVQHRLASSSSHSDGSRSPFPAHNPL